MLESKRRRGLGKVKVGHALSILVDLASFLFTTEQFISSKPYRVGYLNT